MGSVYSATSLIFGLSQGGIESVQLPPQANGPATTLGAGHEGGIWVIPSGPTSLWLAWEGYDLEEIRPAGRCPLDAFDRLLALGRPGIRRDVVLRRWRRRPGASLLEILIPGFLARVAVSDGTITMLGSMEGALDVAVDDECVYWTSASGLYSLSKTATQPFALDGVPPPGAGDAGVNVAPSTDGGADAGACVFQASSYDRSCALDGDCVVVISTDYCTNTACDCGGDPISVAGRAQFNTDISRTPLGSGALQWPPCSCETPAPICCRAGMCTHDCITAPEGDDGDGGPSTASAPR